MEEKKKEQGCRLSISATLINLLVVPVIICFGAYLAPEKIFVSGTMDYIWIFLLQIPIQIVLIIVTSFATTILMATGVRMGTMRTVLLSTVLSKVFRFACDILVFLLLVALLSGLRIFGFWTYLLLECMNVLLKKYLNRQDTDKNE